MTPTQITFKEYGSIVRADTPDSEGGGTWLRPSVYRDPVRVAREYAAEYTAIAEALEAHGKLIGALEHAYETCGQASNEAGIRAILAHLDGLGLLGRPVPEGGKVLTAQQLEDIRSLVGINGVIHASVRQETSRRLRVSLDPWSLPPQPVERCRCGVLEDEPSDGCEWHSARAEKAAEPEQWSKWQDVPEGVTFKTDKVPGVTWNRGYKIAVTTNARGRAPGDLNEYGPFVRVEEGEQA